MLDRLLAPFAPQMLSVLRITTALTFLSHGTIKLMAFPVAGPSGMVGFEILSLRWFAAAIELVGGLFLLAGLFTRTAAFICSGFAAFAFFIGPASRGSLIPALNTGEAAYLFCFVFLYFASAGGGPWSLDAMRGGAARGDAARR